MELFTALALFASHYVGDFLLQRREVALHKSEDLKCLAEHTIIMFIVTMVFMLVTGKAFIIVMSAALLYAVLHGLQDKFIWRMFGDIVAINNYKKGSAEFDRWFFTTLGLDQMLHMMVMFGIVTIILL